MHWRIAPSFVKETALMVQKVEIVQISIGPQPVQTADFKVRPLIIC